jgi:ankyrin repeat protein
MYHQEALTLLRWLAYARSPPTLGELIDAAITDPVEESFVDTSERGGLRDALNILAGLVTIEEEQVADTENHLTAGFATNDTPTAGDDQGAKTLNNQHLTTTTRIRLAHFSVKEYLESERIFKSSAKQFYLESATGHRALSQSCLTYMRYYTASPEKTLTHRDFETFPLLKYAAQSWFYHCALQQGGETDREVSFLQNEQAKDDWLLIHNPDAPWSHPFEVDKFQAKVPGSAMYHASLLGLSVAVRSLFGSGADVNAQGGRYGSALHAAAEKGHTEIAQLLVDKGADVNAQGGRYGSALQAAAAGGHTEIAQLLVDKGTDVNAQGGRYGSALQAAAAGGHTEIAQLLVDKGADVNAQGGMYGSALQAAAARGRTEMARLLVDRGADVDLTDCHGWTPSVTAVVNGHDEVADLLTPCNKWTPTGLSRILSPAALVHAVSRSGITIQENSLAITAGWSPTNISLTSFLLIRRAQNMPHPVNLARSPRSEQITP